MTTTPPRELGRAYEPQQSEAYWYDFWNSRGHFKPVDRGRGPFVIIMPPPNVTGELHMGHALFTAVEDIVTRYKRMQGYAALWMPGADHAGIAGQWVVEKELATENLTRHDLGREAFLARTWDWMETYQERIKGQLRSLGASCDWSRFVFTMDPGPALAVRTAFKHLFDKGLVYRGERLISWCPRCMTALSDLEVVHQDEPGFLWHLRYPLADGSGFISVATTRPETMLGDSGIAVHPDDERYQHLIGAMVRLPLTEREIPVVADAAVDPAFGSGAVKVTPAHDPNDFEIGQRHSLPSLVVMHFDATMNDLVPAYAGMTTAEARAAVVRDLEALGLLERVEPHTHSVGHCDRCGTVIEPMISKQWFVRMEPLAKPALQAVYDKRVVFIPERFENDYLHWMENVHDWCVSRQLWWGHRIPVWTCEDCGHQFAAIEERVSACESCGHGNVSQDPDVLDTWFSSGLWPFSTLGWPQDNADLQRYYPGHLMETGYDIIFHWVSRMIFFGIEFMGEVPFSEVYLHGTVRDAHGQRMSKTKGNVLDPTIISAEYGTDALRFALITSSGPGNDLKMSNERVESARNFANKLFNATKFALRPIAAAGVAVDADGAPRRPDATNLRSVDRWILQRLDRTIADVTRLTDGYQLHEAGRSLYEFVWSEFCDWYIEAAKVRLYADAADATVAQTLAYVLDQSLRLLHPFMPFVTEELWQQLPHSGDALIVASWPTMTVSESDAGVGGNDFEQVREAVRLIRNVRAEQGVDPGKRVAATVIPDAGSTAFSDARDELIALARLDGDQVTITSEAGTMEQAVSLVLDGAVIYLPLAGLVDMAAERERLEREMDAARDEIARADSMLNNEQFTSRAPEKVVDGHRQRRAAAQERLATLMARRVELD